MNYRIGMVNKMECCRKAFRSVYQIGHDYLTNLCHDVKKQRFGIRPPILSDRSNPGTLNERELDDLCDQLDFDLTPDQISAMQIQNSEIVLDCSAWMNYYFHLVGDYEPNTAGEIHLEPCLIGEVHKMYEQDRKANPSQTILGVAQFARLWKNCYS